MKRQVCAHCFRTTDHYFTVTFTDKLDFTDEVLERKFHFCLNSEQCAGHARQSLRVATEGDR